MPYAGKDFSVADPGGLSAQTYSIDVGANIAPGDSIASLAATLTSSSDPSASSRLILSPLITGTVVSQMLGNLLPGTYLLTFIITTGSNQTFSAWNHISVVAPV
jgi:hypothetical protein